MYFISVFRFLTEAFKIKMLTDKDKKEMLEDGLSKKRQESFRAMRDNTFLKMTFDEYLYFLDDFHRTFKPIEKWPKEMITRFNKL